MFGTQPSHTSPMPARPGTTSLDLFPPRPPQSLPALPVGALPVGALPAPAPDAASTPPIARVPHYQQPDLHPALHAFRFAVVAAVPVLVLVLAALLGMSLLDTADTTVPAGITSGRRNACPTPYTDHAAVHGTANATTGTLAVAPGGPVAVTVATTFLCPVAAAMAAPPATHQRSVRQDSFAGGRPRRIHPCAVRIVAKLCMALLDGSTAVGAASTTTRTVPQSALRRDFPTCLLESPTELTCSWGFPDADAARALITAPVAGTPDPSWETVLPCGVVSSSVSGASSTRVTMAVPAYRGATDAAAAASSEWAKQFGSTAASALPSAVTLNVTHYGIVAQAVFTDAAPLFVERSAADALSAKTVYGTAAAPALPAGMVAVAPSSLTAAVPVSNSVRSPWFLVAVAIVVVGAVAVALVCAGVTPPRPSVASCALLLRCCDDDNLAHALSSGDYDSSSPPGSTRTHPRLTLKNIPFATDAVSGAVPTPAPAGRARDQLPREGDPEDQARLFAQPIGRGTALTVGGDAVLTNTAPVQPQGESQLESEHEDGMWATNAEPGSHQNTELQVTDAGQISDAIGPPGRRASTPPSAGHQHSPHGGSPGLPSLPHEHGDGASTQGSTVSSESLSAASEEAIDLLVTDEISRRFAAPAFDGGMDGMDGRGADGRYRVREETSTILAVRLGPQSERYSQLSQMILDFAANADKSEGMRLASLCFIAPGIERGLLFDGPSAAADACSVAARIAEVIHAKSQVERHRDTHLTAGFSSPSVVVVTCHARVFITTGPEGRQTVCGTAAERIMALSHLNNVIRTMAICDEATMRQARVAAVAGGDQDAAIARRMRQVLGEEAGAFCHPSFTLVPCDRVAFPTDMKQFSVVTQSTSVPAGASTSVQRAGAGFGAGMSYSGSAVSKSGSLKEQMVFDIHPARFDGTADDALALKEFNAVLNHAGQPRCEWSDVAARLTSSIQRLAVRAAASLNAQAAAAAAREETASALEPGESSASLEEPGLGHGTFPMGDRPPPVTTEALLAMTLLDVWRQATSLPMLTSSPCLLVGTESGRRFFTRTDSGQSTASDYVYATVRSKRRRRGAGDGGTGQGGVKLLDAMAPSSLPSTASGVKPTLPAPLWFVLVHAKRLLLQADMRRVAGVTKGAGYSMRRPGWEAFPTEMTGSGELASDHSSSRAGRLSASPGAALAPMMGPTFGTFGSRRGPPLITPAALPDIPGQESESDSGPPPGQASAATRPAGESAGTPGERPSPKSRARSYLRATETTEGTSTDPYGDLPPALPLEFPQVLSPTDAPPEGFNSVPAVASITSADAPPPPQVIAAANDEGRFFGDTEELCHTPFDNPLWDAYYLRRDVAAALRRVAQQKQRLAEKRLEKQTKLEEQNTGGGFGLLTFMSPDDEELNEDVFINEALPPPSQGVGSDRQSLDYFIDRRNWKWSLSTQFIGSGAFGNVYSGIGQNGVIVAIKQHDLWTNQPHVCDQCIRETRALARASAETQHIAQYVSAAVVGRWLCVVQQALGGGTLAELTSSAYPKLPMSVIVRCLRDILRGLEHLEDRFMVHRDVKPANIMRDSYGNCKLIDFGTARWLGGISGHRARAQHSSFDVGDTTDDGGGRQRRTFGDSVNEVLTPRPDGGGYESMIPQTLRKLVHRHHRSSDIGVSGIDEVARELAARHLQQTANPPPAQQTAWGGGGGPNLPGGLPPLPANVAQDAATAIAQTAEVRPPTNEAIPMQPAMSSPDEGSTSQRPGGSLVAPPKPEVGQWTTEQAGLLEKAVKTALSQPRAAAAAAGPALVPALTTGGGLPPRAPGALSTASVVTDGPGAASARTALPTPHSNAAPDSAPPPVVFGSTLPDAPRSALASTGPTSSQGSGTFRGIPTVPPATVEDDSPQGGPAVLPAPLPPLSGLSSLAAPAPGGPMLPGQDLLGPGHLPSGHASLASIAYNPSSYGGGLPGVPSVPAALPEPDDLRGTVPVPNLGGPPVAPLIGLTPAPLPGDGMAAPGTPALGHLRPGGPGFSPNTSTSSQHVPSVPGVVVGAAADRPRDSSNTGDAPAPRTPSAPSAGGLSGSLLGPATEQLPVVVPAAAPPVFAPPIGGVALPMMVGGGVVVPPPALASIITPQVPGGGSVAGSGGSGSVLGGNLFPAPMGPPPATASAGTTSGERQRSLPLPSVSGAVGGSVVGGGMSGALSPGAEEAGGVCGTPQFMAPEIANGEIHPRSDIWSFGVVALMLVTQQGPYPEFASTPQEALVKTLATCRRRPITTIVQHPKLRHLVERCLSIDPRERPSAKQLLQEEIFSEAIDAPAQDTSRSN